MAFGQQSGYPASVRQTRRLEELLLAAGHASFRDARGALGLTQRQAGGKFTRDEADDLIARLEAHAEGEEGEEAERGAPMDAAVAPRPTRSSPTRRGTERAPLLEKVPDDVLAAELQRRGWIVIEP
jgi:hypothetical protein